MLVVALVAWLAEPASSPPIIEEAAPSRPTADRERAAYALLATVGNTQPTEGMVQEVVVWSIAEDGGDGALERHNPWNTTMCGFGQAAPINSDGACGVGAYATFEDGIAANAATLMQGNFSEVRAALLSNDVEGFRQALWASPWAASHYGYGAGWVEETQVQSRTRVSSTGQKYNVTPTMEIGAHFDTTDCGAWGFQVGCQHWGTDLLGAEGTPVVAPFDLTIIALGEYPHGPTWGQYVQGTFADGYVFYAGHLEGRQSMQVGQTLPAGTLLGFTNGYAHTHVQLAGPGNTGPCAQDGSCVNFEVYFKEH